MEIKPQYLPSIERNVTDAAKGLLILLVILGHAANIFSPEPFIFLGIKFFHVACFLLLPFVYEIKPLTWASAKDKFKRIYWPFIMFTILYGLAYAILLDDKTIKIWLGHIIGALAIGSGPHLDRATGLLSLWFLPAYMGMTFFVSIVLTRLKNITIKHIIITACISLLVGIIPQYLKSNLPLGAINVLYLFFTGLCIRKVLQNPALKQIESYTVHFFLAAVLLFIAAFATNTFVKFPIMVLPGIFQLQSWIIIHGLIFCVFMFLMTNNWLCRSKRLIELGKISLPLYLLHLPFVLLPQYLFSQYISEDHRHISSWIWMSGIFIFSLIGAQALIHALKAFPPIYFALFPGRSAP